MWPGEQVTELRGAYPFFPMAQGSTNEQIQAKVHAHFHFWSKWSHSQRVRTARKKSKCSSLCGSPYKTETTHCLCPPSHCQQLAAVHANAASHTVFLIVEYLSQHNVATLLHAPYSHDQAPSDFFLFQRIKSTLKGKHHDLVEAVQQAVTRELKSIPVQAFMEEYENGKIRWKHCVDVEGCYFEKF